MAASSLLLLSLFLLFVPLALATPKRDLDIVYHGGPILAGNIDLSLLWYGPFGRVQKNTIRSFIKSINHKSVAARDPLVSSWWEIVESYQTVAQKGKDKGGRAPPIRVKVVSQVTDVNYSVGKVLIIDFILPLVQKAASAAGARKTLAVIFAGRGVTVHGLCMGKCAIHGVAAAGAQPYIVVGEPETECPGACAWPFHPPDVGPKGPVLLPPNRNIGADAMVIALASGLAEVVTNNNKTGYFGGIPTRPTEIADACAGIFGSGASPGNTGKVLTDPVTRGAYNAVGVKNKKFLLPGIWNPKTSSCWTPL